MLAQPRQRRPRFTPHIGRLAFNLLCLAQRFRSLSSPSSLFRRRVVSQAVGAGWIPRTWVNRRGVLFK